MSDVIHDSVIRVSE